MSTNQWWTPETEERVAEAIKDEALELDGDLAMGTGRWYAAIARAALAAMGEPNPRHLIDAVQGFIEECQWDVDPDSATADGEHFPRYVVSPDQLMAFIEAFPTMPVNVPPESTALDDWWDAFRVQMYGRPADDVWGERG